MKQQNKNENEDNASTEGLYTSESSAGTIFSYSLFNDFKSKWFST